MIFLCATQCLPRMELKRGRRKKNVKQVIHMMGSVLFFCIPFILRRGFFYIHSMFCIHYSMEVFVMHIVDRFNKMVAAKEICNVFKIIVFTWIPFCFILIRPANVINSHHHDRIHCNRCTLQSQFPFCHCFSTSFSGKWILIHLLLNRIFFVCDALI